MDFVSALAAQFKVRPEYVQNIIALIDEGATIPFIARYRKELHGSMDDQIIRELCERLEYLRALEKRREDIRKSITEQGKMTDEIEAALCAATVLAELEDIYRPYKPKRKTRASVAKEKGLEPLADLIFAQECGCPDPLTLAVDYVNPELGVECAEDALQGAMDIIAEMISDDANIRKRLRNVALLNAILESKAMRPEEDSVYAVYYEFREPVHRLAGYQILALDRGEREEFLKISLVLDLQKGLNILRMCAIKEGSPCTDTVRRAAEDAYARLIFPSIERELRSMLTESAAEQSIKVFALNLRPLLMQPPVKGCVAMGLDPGYRTGCKVAVVDPTGRVLDTDVIYPTHSAAKIAEGKASLKRMILTHKVNVIAIGNGTASKETEMFTADLIREIKADVSYMVISEAGASVYSASKIAAEEFPDYDLTLRSAISLARRLQDPLAELVKIDPKAIGVGQYQHDMPKKRLDESLGGVVEDCVNTVGVDLNTASAALLQHVSGINATVSKNIVKYREENGAFSSRSELKKVPKLGAKAFEQCAGFMRVPESKNVLDNTAVHPESYKAAKGLIECFGFTLQDLKKGTLNHLPELVAETGFETVAQQVGTGVPTLRDMVAELLRPGRDPRDELPPPMLRSDVLDIKDLSPGMELLGTVRNVIDFGAFVDIGVHQDGLVHISALTDHRVKHPSEVVTVGDIVTVWVLSVDEKKGRISLTMQPDTV